MSFFLDNLLMFGRVLRRAGIEVQPGRLLDVVAALGHVDLSAREEVRHACRALLVHRHEQFSIFDRAFDAFWRLHERRETSHDARSGESPGSMGVIEEVLLLDESASGGTTEDGSAPDPERGLKTWSDRGGVADKDFSALTTDEMREARQALSRLEWNPGERRTRRWVRGRGSRIDLRRAIADSLRTGGEMVRLPRRTRRVHPRPLVLLCDVSGSMERYSRMLLHFAHALTLRHNRVEAFLFSIRLTRITRQLHVRRTDEALAGVAQTVPDWSGGTRIGGAVKEFHQRWGRRVLNGGPVVLLISDGWDRGDPEELRAQIARLQRRCYRLVWLNPLIGTADYAPLTRGLRAALPYVDDFLPSRTLTNLVDLASHLNSLARVRLTPVTTSARGRGSTRVRQTPGSSRADTRGSRGYRN
jgi:uncharacterized protein with von Willebrand factor type A (vWA) domain